MPTNYYLKYIKNFWEKKNVKTGTFRKEWAKSMNRKCTEEETQMADSILKNMSNPSVIRGKQIVTAVRYCSESVHRLILSSWTIPVVSGDVAM